MLWGVDLGAPTLRRSMKQRGPTQKMQLSTFLKPVGENHCVKYYKHNIFQDSPLTGTLSVGIEALNPEVGIKFVYATEGF